MSGDKRPASGSFGASQVVVKRQKSEANIANGSAVALAGDSKNGALIQSVSYPHITRMQRQSRLNSSDKVG